MSRFTAFLLGVAALLPASCGRPSRPNVILVIVDTLRADALSCYGASAPTPAFDRIAGEGVRFEHAVAQAPWTAPSIASILTSQYPHEHGIGVTLVGAGLPSGVSARDARRGTRSLAEPLRAHGYRTALFAEISCDLLQRAAFESCYSSEGYSLQSAPSGAELTFSAARRWLKMNSRVPFLLAIHTYEVHDYYKFPPYAKQSAIRTMPDYKGPFFVRGTGLVDRQDIESLLGASDSDIAFVKGIYRATVARVDEEIAELDRALTDLSLQENTVLVITSDHGEGLDPTLKRVHHGGRLHEDLLDVPLIIRWRGHVEPGIVKSVVESIDIAPTLLTLLQVPADTAHRGKPLLTQRSASTLFFQPGPLSSARAFSEESARLVDDSGRQRVSSTQQVAVHSPPYKLIRVGSRVELYDLVQDPKETINIAGRHPDKVRALIAAIDGAVGQVRPDPAAKKETGELLRGLGYVR